MDNTGSSIIIIGCLHFGYTYGFNWWLYILIVLSILAWLGVDSNVKEKELRLIEAKTKYYNQKSD